MKTTLYLCVKKSDHRLDPSFRVTKTKPGLDHNEIAVKVNLELPDALFKSPQLEAEIKVSDKAVSPAVIPAEVVSDAERIIKEQTGFTVKLTVVEEE